MALAAIRVLGHDARSSISSRFSPINTSLLSHHHKVDVSSIKLFTIPRPWVLCKATALAAVSQQLWLISIPGPGPLLSPQAIMRICHSISWLLTAFACGVVCAGEAQFGSGVIDKVEDVVGGDIAQAGGLASVSVPHQSIGVSHCGSRETLEHTNNIDIIIDTCRLTSQG